MTTLCALWTFVVAFQLSFSVLWLFLLKSKMKQGKLIILSDCKSAIKCILRRSVMHHHHALMARVRSSVCALRDWKICIVLTWIPSHSNILFSEKADLLAKQALQQLPVISRNPFTFPTWKSLTVRQMIQCWQIRWDRSTTGRATYDIYYKQSETKLPFRTVGMLQSAT